MDEDLQDCPPPGAFPVAIVGIGCRMPGGINTTDKYWDVLKEGRECIQEIPPDRWVIDSFYDPDQTKQGKMATKRCGFIDDVNGFDNLFFKISPREAASMDPQQRHLLEVSWEAFEDAGILPENLKEKCGVFVGIGMMDHAIQITDTSVTDAYTLTGIAHSVASNRLSYCFDFRGPSFSIDTACASGLTALHLACTSLWNKECKVAVVATCNLLSLPDITVAFSALGVLSPDGRCSPFSNTANGYVRSEGWNTMILKPLDQALADGDHIYTVMKGSLIADNGRSSSLTMPSVPAMEYCMNETYKKFGVSMADVHFLEAHGTGTHVGDPLEAEAIGRSFAPKRDKPIKIGSIKGNFGHTEIAAGTASAIKIALMMEHRMLVPTANYIEPNSHIDIDAWKLDVVTKPEPFTEEKYIMGLNSFGFAGALAHCIFEEAPKKDDKKIEHSFPCGWKFGDKSEGKSILIPLSAKSPEALTAVAKQWSDFESDRDAVSVVSWLATHRTHFDYRMSVISKSGHQFRSQMKEFVEKGSSDGVLTTTVYSTERPKVCMVFPGQGQQWADMGRQLYETEDVFKSSVDECDQIFKKISGWSLLNDEGLFAKSSNGKVCNADAVMNNLEVSQPAILFLQIAYAKLLQHWGIIPDVVVGHSLGEVAAAYVSGGMTLEESILVIYIRSVEQGKLKGTGSMAALRMSADEASVLCSKYDRLYIAAYNAPGSVTIAGNTSAIVEISNKNPTVAKQLRVSCAFHTPDMDPTEKSFKAKMKNAVKTPAGTRSIPVYSTLTGAKHEGDFATDYWWNNIRNAVKFQQAVESILKDVGPTVFVECAASATLMSSINAIAKGIGGTSQITTITLGQRKQDDRVCALRALHALHSASTSINWSNVLVKGAPWIRTPMYPWQHVVSLTEPDYRKKRRLGLDDRTFKGQNGNITLELFPFLADHVIDGSLTFPESGLVAYAIEEAVEKGPLQLSNIRLPEETDWAVEKSSVGIKRQTLGFQCTIKDDVLQIMDNGKTCLSSQVHKLGMSSFDETHIKDMLDQYQRRCTTSVSQDEIYQSLESAGLELGPKFRIIQDAQLGDGEVIAHVDCSHGDRQSIVTTMLSACFHALIFPMSSSSALFKAVRIRSLKIFSTIAPCDEIITLLARISDCDNNKLTGDVYMVNDKGYVLMELLECVFKNTVTADSITTLDECLYQTIYQPTNAILPPTSMVTDLFHPDNLRKLYPVDMEAITRAEDNFGRLRAICDAYIRHGLETVPPSERLESHPLYLKRLIDLTTHNDITRIAYDDIQRNMDELLQLVPELQQEVKMVKSLGEHLPTTLRDPPSAMRRIFQPDCMATYFMNSLTTRLYYKSSVPMIRNALEVALSQKKVVRILEIGARMGGLTKHILEEIAPLCEQGRVEYIFTDLSVAFFPHARETLEDFPFVKYQQLDVEQDIESQGFIPATIDILLCLDTLHSTVHAYDSVAHMRNLIVDDGWFILYEATEAKYIAELLFGALRLCWIFEDFRTECCWMDQAAWVDIVKNSGFTDVVAVSSPKRLFHSIIVGKKSGGYEAFPPKPVIEKKGMEWIIVSEEKESKFVSAVEEDLRIEGEIKRISFKSLKSRKSLLNSSKTSSRNVDCIFVWNKSDIYFDNLLRYLEQVNIESEYISRAWVIVLNPAGSSNTSNAQTISNIVRSAANVVSCPLYSMELLTDGLNGNARSKQVSDILLKQQVAHRELVLKEGEWFESKLVKLQMPELPVTETPYWELQLRHETNHSEGSKLCLSFNDNLPNIGPDDVLIKVRSANLSQSDVLKHLETDDSDKQDMGSSCSGIVHQVGANVKGVKTTDEVFTLTKQSTSSHVMTSPCHIVRKPQSFSWSECVSSFLPLVTAYHSLIERAHIKRHETLLVKCLQYDVKIAAVQIAHIIGAKVILCALDDEESSKIKRYLAESGGINEVTIIEKSGKADELNDLKVDVLLYSSSMTCDDKLDWVNPGGRVCDVVTEDGLHTEKSVMKRLTGNKSYFYCDINAMAEMQPTVMQTLLRKISSMCDEGVIRPISSTSFPIESYKQMAAKLTDGSLQNVTFEIQSKPSFAVNQAVGREIAFKKTVTYIIGGSEHALGQAFARWLCKKGARHIAMIANKKTSTAVTSRTMRFLTKRGCTVYPYSINMENERNVAEVIRDLKDVQMAPNTFGLIHVTGLANQRISFSDLAAKSLKEIVSPSTTSLDNLINAIDKSNIDLLLTLTPESCIWGSPEDVGSGVIDAFYTDRVEQLTILGKTALNIQLSSLSSLDVYGGNSDAQDLIPFNDSSLHIDEFLIHLEKILLSSDCLSSSVSVSTQDWNNIVRDCHSYHLKCLNLASGKQVAVSDCRLTAEELELRMKEKVGDLLCIDAKSIDINQPMLNYGIDSLMSVEMVTWASREWGAVISQLDILGGVTTKALIDSAMNKKMAVSSEIKIDIFSK